MRNRSQGQNLAGSVASILQHGAMSNPATYAALNAILYALNTNAGQIDVVAFSGGAGAFTAAYNLLSATAQARIGLILYVSPGAAGTIADITGYTTVVEGSSLSVDPLATGVSTVIPSDIPVAVTPCGHDFGCLSTTPTATNILDAMFANGGCNNPEVFTRTNYNGTPGYGVPSGGGGSVGVNSGPSLQQTFVPGQNGEPGSWTVGMWVSWPGPQSPKFYAL